MPFVPAGVQGARTPEVQSGYCATVDDGERVQAATAGPSPGEAWCRAVTPKDGETAICRPPPAQRKLKTT